MKMRVRFRKILVALVIAVVPLAISACKDDIVSPDENLAAARALWATAGPTTYTMTVSHSCECATGVAGLVVVRVKNGAVESRRFVTTGEPVNPLFASAYPTVEGLFDFVKTGMQREMGSVEVEYDAETGYPTRIVAPDMDQPDIYTVSILED